MPGMSPEGDVKVIPVNLITFQQINSWIENPDFINIPSGCLDQNRRIVWFYL
jgi:hypothetical protein